MKNISILHIFLIIVCMVLFLNINKPNPTPDIPIQPIIPAYPNPQPNPTPEPQPNPEPEPVLTFEDVPIYRTRIVEESKYADIINRARNPVLEYDRDTDAHETTHMIQADLRNNINKGSEIRHNSFYLLGGKSISFPEPSIKKRDIIPYVPSILQESRYDLYVRRQEAWDNEPLYLVDEWCAYMNGAEVAIEEYKTGRHDGTMYDVVKGPLEFSVYCTALCMAIKDKDPEYWEVQIAFRHFMKTQLQRSYNIVMEGLNIREFQGYRQQEFITTLRESEQTSKLRQFLIDNFDGIWVSKQ